MRRATFVIISSILLASCSNTADPAEVSKLADSLSSTTSPIGIPLTPDQAKCAARAYLEAGLSDEAIKALQDGKPLAPATKDDTKAIQKISAKIPDCLT